MICTAGVSQAVSLFETLKNENKQGRCSYAVFTIIYMKCTDAPSSNAAVQNKRVASNSAAKVTSETRRYEASIEIILFSVTQMRNAALPSRSFLERLIRGSRSLEIFSSLFLRIFSRLRVMIITRRTNKRRSADGQKADQLLSVTR